MRKNHSDKDKAVDMLRAAGYSENKVEGGTAYQKGDSLYLLWMDPMSGTYYFQMEKRALYPSHVIRRLSK